MTAGLVVLIAAMAIATVAGAGWRAANGRIRVVPPGGAVSGPVREDAAAGGPAAGDPGGATGMAGLTMAGPAAGDAPGTGAAPSRRLVAAADLGRPLGERATLLQFSSAFCAPCRATRVILADAASRTEGVAHIEIDAEARMDLVRALGVLRTPTFFVLAADGSVTARASGQPRRTDVLAALGRVL